MLSAALERQARERPDALALIAQDRRLDYLGLQRAVRETAERLRRRRVSVLALALPNGLPWVVLDLAALEAGIALVPIPPFFTPAQAAHCLRQSAADALLTLPGAPHPGGLAPQAQPFELSGAELAWLDLPGGASPIPEGIAKVTFTSGTTGAPKGVMLEAAAMQRVAAELAQAAALGPGERHCCISPLAILLENVGGVYAPLLQGLTVVLPDAAAAGLRGAAGLDPQRLAETLTDTRAASAILSPAMLHGLLHAGLQPGALRFLAVGGAKLSPKLLEQAQAQGLPVFEGYGLSECASVVTLNRPGANRPGSVGRPLPQCQVRIDASGEVLVRGRLFRGYLGAPAPQLEDGWWRTGDLGRFDADGFLYLDGRRKNLIVTAFSRNLSPEWVEQELLLEPAIAQAALFGDGRPWNLALVTPAPGAAPAQVEAALARVNAELPDYARVGGWLATEQPFGPRNGLLTATGRLRRQAIFERYREAIEGAYAERHHQPPEATA